MDRDTVVAQVRQFRAAVAKFNQRLRDSGFFAVLQNALDEGREKQ